jgi:quercetin dioxygenase-like cupin family protein
MDFARYLSIAAAAAVMILPSLAIGQGAPVRFPGGSVAKAFNEQISNIPGKSIVASVVSYDPGGKSPPHRHAHSAFITAYVISGAIRSQVEGGEVKIYHTGESWTEQPGAHHTISENASDTEPASLLAIFVVDTADTALTTFDGK